MNVKAYVLPPGLNAVVVVAVTVLVDAASVDPMPVESVLVDTLLNVSSSNISSISEVVVADSPADLIRLSSIGEPKFAVEP